jgi:hypothetical protein
MTERWPAMLTGPNGERLAWDRLADVPQGWRSRNPETQAEIDARYPSPISDDDLEAAIRAELEKPEPTRFVGPNGETWAGRGRKPRWLVEQEAANGDGA